MKRFLKSIKNIKTPDTSFDTISAVTLVATALKTATLRVATITVAVCALCSLNVTPAMAAQPPQPAVENINTQEELIQWYRKQTGANNTVGILSKGMIIKGEVRLSPLNPTEKEPIQLQILEGPVRIIGQGALTIDDPNLSIFGPHHFFTVEESGKLALTRGNITAGDKTKTAIVCRTREQVIISQDFGGAKELKIEVSDTPGPNSTPPDESHPQPVPGPPEQDLRPELTEVILLNIAANGNGSARLNFVNLPTNITALYISRSPDGKLWTKEKNKKNVPSSQGGQDTVEYENFLKEPGNTLDTSIVNDGYMTYNFQSSNQSFYIKVRLEWPDGAWESGKTKVAVPEYTGQGLTFAYGGGGYGGYSRPSGNSGVGSYGSRTYNEENIEGTSEEKDAPKGLISRGGGGLSWKDFLPNISSPAPESTKKPENASPSTAKYASGVDKALNQENDSEQPDGDSFRDLPSQTDGEILSKPSISILPDNPDSGRHKKAWLAPSIIIVALIGVVLVRTFRHK